jgi:hypothetical protein
MFEAIAKIVEGEKQSSRSPSSAVARSRSPNSNDVLAAFSVTVGKYLITFCLLMH